MYHRLTALALSVFALVGLVTINPTPAGATPAASTVTASPFTLITTSAMSKVTCRGTIVKARSKRACPRAARITAASVQHVADSTTFTFGVDVRPRSRRWVDQVREVEWTLGASEWSTLQSFFGATRQHRIRETLQFPVQWHESEWKTVCANVGGSHPTTLTVVVTTVGGVRSAPFRMPVTVAIREWDLGGRFDAFGVQTYLYCLSSASGIDDAGGALP